ncbi:MAG: RNA polymerase sigma factor [Bacteroidota bacterium]|nr:RNA polymerase sigma factor [Bacteroidota bacterium]
MNLQEIILGCKNRELKSERELFYLYAKKLHALARKYTHDIQEADDMMQESFIRIYGQIHKYQESKGKFDAWMYRVSVNTMLQIIRANKNKIYSLPVESLPDMIEEETEYMEVSPDLINRAMSELPKGYKEVFSLYVLDGWSHKQIASHLKISEGTSRSQLTKAKRYLRSLLHSNQDMYYERESNESH